MSQPATREEYEARFAANQVVDGFGLDVHMVTPCPFCAAPGWATWYPAGELAGKPSIDAQMEQNQTCRECGRSARAIITRTAGGVSAEFVQTGGPPSPAWLDPPPRRIPGD